MKNKVLLSVFTLSLMLVSFSLSAQSFWNWGGVKGNGNVVKVDRHLTGFDEISVSSGLDLYISQGDNESVVVEADENLQDIIMTKVDGNRLKLYVDKSIRNAKAMKVHVTVKDLKELRASAGSDVVSQTGLTVSSLEIGVSSGSDVKMEVYADQLSGGTSSGSDLTLRGKAKNFHADSSSGSDINAYDLTAEDCTAEASSGSDIRLTVNGNFEAHASSGADIYYKGTPTSINTHSSSGGDVNKR
ncbi:lipoprotein [Prolixibacter bellariivorans]|uniref:Lipoprotein n=1 Tax=Prolixibacter bellariivorans TaxID=314319 RepID=A0A5M4AXU5_9BACT|nr:head GIN domain-containing protein [Prolixibacter bellariivorans]GET32730.1 lipoprotein [Prolixibacter bellariivorans]